MSQFYEIQKQAKSIHSVRSQDNSYVWEETVTGRDHEGTSGCWFVFSLEAGYWGLFTFWNFMLMI